MHNSRGPAWRFLLSAFSSISVMTMAMQRFKLKVGLPLLSPKPASMDSTSTGATCNGFFKHTRGLFQHTQQGSDNIMLFSTAGQTCRRLMHMNVFVSYSKRMKLSAWLWIIPQCEWVHRLSKQTPPALTPHDLWGIIKRVFWMWRPWEVYREFSWIISLTGPDVWTSGGALSTDRGPGQLAGCDWFQWWNAWMKLKTKHFKKSLFMLCECAQEAPFERHWQ